ncbi:MAG TPA: PLP-dependent aspartate aminotransferase family protein [Candidatus Thermoplasmatota archaeon]|nr:PLP-dependent aspartate aminotransferase family protein [Candidatus Thermoplasmatota archaeon]
MPKRPAKSRASDSGHGASTLAVHAGEATDPRSGAVNVPIQQSTTFRFPELEDGSKAPYIYSRYENPSLESVEAKVAALEGALPGRSLLFSSGMGAIQAACTAFTKPGDVLAVQRGVYGGTTSYLSNELAPFGVKVVEIDARGPPALPKGTTLVWLESITNPLLRVADPRPWAKAAKEAGARLVVDATFASPLLQKPLSLGADVAMHSATKYLGGHADVTAGVLTCADAPLRDNLWTRRRNLGPILDPHAAYLVGRGMKTLALRMERHCSNAWALAQECEGLAGVKAVHYPGLPSHPDHATARKVLAGGFGGMLTLDLGSKARAVRFRRRVRVVTPAASLGGVESLVSLPLETSHAYASAAKRRSDGIGDGLVRISVGIEDASDLAADLRQAIRGD